MGPGLRLDLRDVAGTVAYHGRGLGCVVDVSLRVHEGATLTWAAEPLVVADGAEVTRHLRVDVADGGRLLLRDQVALGRSGQEGGRLDCHTTMTYAGRPALVEHLEVRSGLGPGALGDARVVDSVTSLGWRPETPAGHAAYRLHEPGAPEQAAAHAGAHLHPAGPLGRLARQLGRPDDTYGLQVDAQARQ